MEKEREPSSNVEGMITQKKWVGKSRFDEVGRIIKNGDLDKNSMSPRKRSHLIKFHSNEEEVVMEPEELPYESARKRPSKFIN